MLNNLNANKHENKINNLNQNDILNKNINNDNFNNNQININTNTNSNSNENPSSNFSIKDRLKLLTNSNTVGFPIPGASAVTSQSKPLNTPIQLNHNIQSTHLNKLNEADKIKQTDNETKKADEKVNKTKEEIEEEKRLKRERMKLKMGNSTNKIIARQNADKEKDAEKLKENKNEENNKVKNLANMLADKIQFAPAAKGQFNGLDAQQAKKSKMNRLFQGNDDVQFEQEEKIIEDDDEGDEKGSFKIQENEGKNAKESDLLQQHQKNLDDEDYFMKQIENRPRMMTTVKKFKKPEFKLDK